MEFLDEDARPRIVFQSRPRPSSTTENETQQKPLNKPLIFISISFSSLLLILSILFVENEPFKSLLIWVSLSFIVGPFAPSHITGGDIRVGQGPTLEPLEEEPEISTEKRAPRKRSKPVRSEEPVVNPIASIGTTTTTIKGLSITEKKDEVLAEEEWNAEDLDILKKQMVKNPVGKPKRWEVIAEVFKGRHRVENVIKKAKEMGEKRLDDTDSYAQFLKNRKAIDSTRVVQSDVGEVKRDNNDSESCNGGGVGVGWTAAEDIALLNALKAFPKDVAMRWEKIAAAVPGKTKAACVKRVSDLKRDFRSSKAGAEN